MSQVHYKLCCYWTTG